MYAYVASYPHNYAIFYSADAFESCFCTKKTILFTIEMYDQFHDVPQQVSIEPLLGTGVLQADFFSRKYRPISWQPLKQKYQKSAR